MSLNQAPIYEFNWKKEGFPGITQLPYGICLLLIEDDTDKTFYLKEYSRFADIVEAEYTPTNYGYMQDIFTYNINKLYVYRIDVGGTIDSKVADDIGGLIIDYGCMPTADSTDETAIISMVNEYRSDFKTHKWIFTELTTNPDAPHFIQFDITAAEDSTGTSLTALSLLPTVMAQRTSKPLTQSFTYDVVGKVADFTPFTKAEIEAKLTGGVIVPFKKNNAIRYVRDINSLVTLGDQYDERFRENQRYATMDTINRDIRNTWETQWVGNYQNSGDNKRGLIRTINKYIKDRAASTTDPVQDGIFYIDWEEHRDILRLAGWTEDEINALDISELEDIDTGTFVYINGQVQINGVMEDIRFNVTLATSVRIPEELQ